MMMQLWINGRLAYEREIPELDPNVCFFDRVTQQEKLIKINMQDMKAKFYEPIAKAKKYKIFITHQSKMNEVNILK